MEGFLLLLGSVLFYALLISLSLLIKRAHDDAPISRRNRKKTAYPPVMVIFKNTETIGGQTGSKCGVYKRKPFLRTIVNLITFTIVVILEFIIVISNDMQMSTWVWVLLLAWAVSVILVYFLLRKTLAIYQNGIAFTNGFIRKKFLFSDIDRMVPSYQSAAFYKGYALNKPNLFTPIDLSLGLHNPYRENKLRYEFFLRSGDTFHINCKELIETEYIAHDLHLEKNPMVESFQMAKR